MRERFVWATVASVGPLRVQIDGDTSPLPFAPDSLVDPTTLQPGGRVRCEFSHNRLIVHGRAGGDVGLQDALTRISAIENTAAMWVPVKPTLAAFAGAGSSAAVGAGGQITFSNCNNLSLDDCYSTVYDEYLWSMVLSGSSSATDVNYRGRTAAGSDYSGTGHAIGTLDRSAAIGVGGGASDSSNSLLGFIRSNGTGGGKVEMIVSGPMLAEYTWFLANMRDAAFGRVFSGAIKTTTQYPGATFFTAGATITGRARLFARSNL